MLIAVRVHVLMALEEPYIVLYKDTIYQTEACINSENGITAVRMNLYGPNLLLSYTAFKVGENVNLH